MTYGNAKATMIDSALDSISTGLIASPVATVKSTNQVNNNANISIQGMSYCGFGDFRMAEDVIEDVVSEEEYNKAKDALWDAVYKQYPLARLRIIKKNEIENVLKEYKDEINEVGKKYGVPPELIAGIIVKEQITQSLPDAGALVDTLIRGKEHSVGLGAIFPSTAKRAWYEVDLAGAYENKIYGSFAEIELRLMNNVTNINTIAVILNYYARQKFKIEDVSNLSMDQWKEVVGRYNASDNNPKAQKKYSDYVYDYLEPLRIMLK